MSSSPSRAPTRSAQDQVEVLPFAYGEVSANAGQPGSMTDIRSAYHGESTGLDAVERDSRARELGRKEGEMQGRANFEEQLARARAAVTAAISGFAHERATYYQKLEEEVVKLALRIARQILHREAQVDPLLLMGIVRVALEKIEGATGVVLGVPPQTSSDWRRYLASHMEPGELPEIVEDPAIAADRCAIRTSMGTAELGLDVQLKEIEQGLMDLMAARPQAAS